ncbi:MAG TPA: hypothetical protein DCS93_27565 [Microscillaceae bacterium]|nr:hypothetical protein [Microscillaceae bacterium]
MHYHTDFPGPDAFNVANEKDLSGRTFFYRVRAVPRLVVDGESKGSLPNYLQVAQRYSRYALLLTPFALTVLPPKLSGQNILQINARLKALIPFNHLLVVQVVLARSSNAGKNYHYVVRKMLPDVAGTFLEAKNWQVGDSLVINLDWSMIRWRARSMSPVYE